MRSHDLAAHVHHTADELHNKAGERRTRWVVLICGLMMLGELTFGWWTGSVALQADGWHMGTHVGALGLALVAYWYARTHASSDTFSFGTGKVYALAGYTSGIILAIVALYMAFEGIYNLATHPHVDYDDALPVAVLGLIVNVVSIVLLGHSHHYGHDHDHHHDHADHEHDADRVPSPGTLDFNLRAAYIHILADAMTSLLAIGALSAGKWAGIWFFDPIMGLVGGAVISWWAIGLCRQASRQLLDIVTSQAEEASLRKRLEAIDDVRVADLHVWELGPGRRACIVSLVTATPREISHYREAVLHAADIAHLTIEVHRCELAHHDRADPGAAAGSAAAGSEAAGSEANDPEVAHAHEH